MLTILPVVTIGILFLDLLGSQGEEPTRPKDWRFAVLQTALIAGAFVALQSEILGLFHALSTVYVAVVWAAALLISAWVGWRQGWIRQGWYKLSGILRSIDRFTGVVIAIFSLIAGLLLVIAVIAPANNMDSLLYHMPRVMHWAQDHSLAHYPTGYEVQLVHPILAELSILQARLLVGNDQFANLPQWLSLVISVVAVSLAAKLLGAGRKAQLAAAAFGISIPIGLMEATSTQNDYVTAMWLTILVVFVLYACLVESSWGEILAIGGALGLGMLTKATFYPYAVAWGVWLIVHWIRQRKPMLLLKRGLVIAAVVIVLNLGYWTRNMVTYGTPLGPGSWISEQSSGRAGIFSVPSNLVKDFLLNYATPSPRINQAMASFVQTAFHSSDPDVSSFMLNWRWNNEDSAGNPVHLLIIFLCLVGVIMLYLIGREKSGVLGWYSLAAVASFIIFALTAHYDNYGVRFQLPLIMIWAPVFGALVYRLGEKWLAPLAIVFFVAISIPYVFFNTTRPIIALKNNPEPYAIHPFPAAGETKASSIFYSSPRDMLFINAPDLNTPLMQATHDIRGSGCKAVGLRIDSHDVEYPVWWLLKAPQSGIRIESLYYSQAVSRYADPNFVPCAIICTICAGRSQLDGLSLFGSYDGLVNLYMGETYVPEGDP